MPETLAERKRRLVIDELTEAALQTLAIKGYDATTIDEVAAAAGVSRRTFFRYFASKEDVVVQLLATLSQEAAAEFVSRPPGEPTPVALHHAVARALDECRPGNVDHAAKALRVVQLILGTPPLLARFLERQSMFEDELTGLIAARLGVDPASGDLRPRLTASMTLSAFLVVLRRWAETDGGADPAELLAEAFEHLNPSLQGLTA